MKKKKSKEFIEFCQNYGVDSSIVPEILTYEEACKLTNRSTKIERDEMQKTIVIIEAFCKQSKFKRNYKDKNQRGWFPVHEMTPSGLVFSHAICEGWSSDSDAGVGAPFVLKTSDEATFVGKHFLPHYSWKLNYKVK